MSKIRLDILLLKRGIVSSREKANALIRAGYVYSKDRVLDKPGVFVPEEIQIFIKEKPKYVSRGGYKLEGAIKKFNLNVNGFVCCDIGASTGGFTDCLLKFGASKVYAIDVGKNLMDENLRKDKRVVLMEGINARYFKEEMINEKVDLITIDVSFISIKKIIPNVTGILKEKGFLLPLIKPQFEVGKGQVGKGGVVRDELKIIKVIDDIISFVENLNFKKLGMEKSPIKGQKGNQEYFILFQRM